MADHEDRFGLDDVVPPDPWSTINDRYHSGARIRSAEVGELLEHAIGLHLEARRLLGEVARLTREREEVREAEARDAARWRFIRQFLDVEGDYVGYGGLTSHAQWITVDEERLSARAQAGWAHTVESLVDAAIDARTQEEP